jgi:hypothetical protein
MGNAAADHVAGALSLEAAAERLARAYARVVGVAAPAA